MNLFRRFVFNRSFPIVLSLIMVTSAFSSAIAQATGTPPPVQLNTFGSLPVMVLNLTQSPINFDISTTTNLNCGTSLAAGLSGVYYPINNHNTSMFTNPLSPATPVSGTAASASLLPIASVTFGNNIAASGNYGFGNLFVLFPSWSINGTYNYVQYVSLGDLNNQGAAAYQYNVIAGYPSGNGKDATTGGDYTTAAVLNASNPNTTSINLNLMNNGQAAAVYSININSLGAGTSAAVQIGQPFSILGAMHCLLDIATDISSMAQGDPLGIADMIAGLASTANGIYQDVSANNGVNANITTDTAYPATSAGINVTAAATFHDGCGGTLTPVSSQNSNGQNISDSQSTLYEVQPAAGQTLPLNEQNAIFVTTFRQSPANNYGVSLPNAADTLIVTVINQGIYSSNQIQQYINNNSPSQLAGAQYKPTKAQAQDTFKILAILTALSKDSPQDFKYVTDMFGVQGQYTRIKNDPRAVEIMKKRLITIFKKYQNQFPAAKGYVSALLQRA